MMYYLSSCSIIKNEFPYIIEFYKIHKYLGVEFFLFYDRSTEGPTLKEIFKNCKDVEIINFPEPNRHVNAWYAGTEYFTGKSKWVQFVDIDEVVIPVKTNDIKVMLQDYEDFGCLGLNWHFLDLMVCNLSQIYQFQLIKLILKELVQLVMVTFIYNQFVKFGERGSHPDQLQQIPWPTPHSPHMKNGCLQVNEQKKSFTGPFNIPATHDIGFIAHYYTRSKEFYNKKLARKRADTGTDYSQTIDDFEENQKELNDVEDFTVKNIWDQVKIDI